MQTHLLSFSLGPGCIQLIEFLVDLKVLLLPFEIMFDLLLLRQLSLLHHFHLDLEVAFELFLYVISFLKALLFGYLLHLPVVLKYCVLNLGVEPDGLLLDVP